MALEFTSATTPKTAVLQTEDLNRNTYVVKNEHSHNRISVIVLRRSLPTGAAKTQRFDIQRSRGVIVDAGLPTERIESLTINSQITIPVGASDTAVTEMIEDEVGLLKASFVDDFVKFSVMPR